MRQTKFFVAVLVAVWGVGVVAAPTGNILSTVSEIILDESQYGGCMAKVSPGPQSLTLDNTCGNNYVTFSCSGDFNSKSVANNKLSAAQLALVTGTEIGITVDSTKKHNGYCWGSQVRSKSEATP